MLGGVCRLVGAGVALCAVAYAPLAAAATIDMHATALTPNSFTSTASGGTLDIHSSNASSNYSTKIGAGPVVGGGGSFDLNITFTSPSTATLGISSAPGFGFKMTAPQSETVTAAIGAVGSYMTMGTNTFISFTNFILNGMPSSSGLMIEIDAFNPGTTVTGSNLNLQADVKVASADVPLPSTAKSLGVLLAAAGVWAIRRRGQLA